MQSISFSLGVLGFIFSMAALGRIRRLEKRLKDAGVLKDTNGPD